MFHNQLAAPLLVALVSLPGFLIGQRLRQGDHGNLLMLLPLLLAVVLVASLLMRQSRD